MRVFNNIPKLNIERLLSKIKINPISQCWEWQGFLDKDGYGQMGNKNAHFGVHRISYDMFVGFKSNTTVVDHICRNRKCCNPDHLREVDCRTNSIENSTSFVAVNSAKTHCLNGHELIHPNIYIYGNRRKCKICIFARTYRDRAKRKCK